VLRQPKSNGGRHERLERTRARAARPACTLLRRARTDHAREHGIAEEIGPGELLMLVTREESFAWLRVLSELMTDIDYPARRSRNSARP